MMFHISSIPGRSCQCREEQSSWWDLATSSSIAPGTSLGLAPGETEKQISHFLRFVLFKIFSLPDKSWSFSLWDALPLLLAPWSSQYYSRWLTGVCWDLCSGPSTLHSSLSLRLKDGSESAGNHQCRLAVVVYIMQWTGTQTIREIIWGSSAKMLGNIDKVGSAQTDWKTEDRFYPISTYYHIIDYSSFFSLSFSKFPDWSLMQLLMYAWLFISLFQLSEHKNLI